MANALYKECLRQDVPMFLAYYLEEKGYQYKALLPGECKENGHVPKEDEKFLDFLRTVRGFDKKNFVTVLNDK